MRATRRAAATALVTVAVQAALFAQAVPAPRPPDRSSPRDVAPPVMAPLVGGGPLAQLLARFATQRSDERLRRDIWRAVAAEGTPALPAAAAAAEKRAESRFRSASRETDLATVAAHYLDAIAAAPWVPAYYYNLCVVLEATAFAAQAAHACQLYGELSPGAPDAAGVRAKAAALSAEERRVQAALAQRTLYPINWTLNQGDVYRVPAAVGRYNGMEMSFRMVVGVADRDNATLQVGKGTPWGYQVQVSCLAAQPEYVLFSFRFYEGTVTMCGQQVPVGIYHQEKMWVSIGGNRLFHDLKALFARLRTAVDRSALVYESVDLGGPRPVPRFYARVPQGEPALGFAMFETDCRGRVLRDDPTAIPDLFGPYVGGNRTFSAPHRPPCDMLFAALTGQDFGPGSTR